MAQQVINIGTSPNDGTGDQLRTAFEKCNDNFTELYAGTGGGAVDSVNGQTGVVVLDATDVDALQRDGSNANSDVDLGAFSLNAKSFHAKGTNGSGHLGLKHQSANPTAGGQETVIFAGSDGEPRYKNDGNAVQQLASQSFVNSGLATKENTITAGTTSQYYRGDKTFQTLDKTAVGLGNVDNTSDLNKPISNATQTALNTKTTILYSSALRSAIHTGTAANTIVFNQLIPANSIINGQTIEIEGKFSKLNTSTLTWNVRCYINNSVSLVGATEIGWLNFASVGNAQCGTLRRRVGRRESNIVYYPTTSASTSDDFQSNATTSISVASVDWSQPQYILICIQLNNTAHQTVIDQLNIITI